MLRAKVARYVWGMFLRNTRVPGLRSEMPGLCFRHLLVGAVMEELTLNCSLFTVWEHDVSQR